MASESVSSSTEDRAIDESVDQDLDVGSVCVPNPNAPAPSKSPQQHPDVSEQQVIERLAQAGFEPPVEGYVDPPELRTEWLIAGTIGVLVALVIAVGISFRQSRMYPPPPPASAASLAEGKPLPKPSGNPIYDEEPAIVTVDVRGEGSASSSSASAGQRRGDEQDGAGDDVAAVSSSP